MASYTAPGVYVKDVVSGSQTISQSSSSIGILIGVTRSGNTKVAKKIGSWTEFLQNFANGLDTPFMENEYLPYSVYGFFQNGGQELYVGSIKKNAKKATKKGSVLTATAASEGTWGNQLTLSIKKSADYDDTTGKATDLIFDITATIAESDESIRLSEVTVDTLAKVFNESQPFKQWFEDVSVTSGVTALGEENITLEGGTDGETLTDSDYVEALSNFCDTLDDVTMVGIPGQTSEVINDAIMSYCDNNGLFPILDYPRGTSAVDAKAYRKSISAWAGCICYPWGKVNDPLTNKLKAVPTVGHVMGVYAASIEERGVFKAPAGTSAVVRGFIEMDTPITQSILSMLNPIGVVCIMSRPNAGIVIWGARSLNSSDSTLRYVSDGLLNLCLKKSLYNGTQFAVFEPNDEKLWKRIDTTCRSFLENLRTEGALVGDPDEAYYVKVDGSNNTEYTIAEGQLNIEIGYAPVKPAEFVVIKLAHSIVSEG